MSFPFTLNIGSLNIYSAVGRTVDRTWESLLEWIKSCFFPSFAEEWAGVARAGQQLLCLQHSRSAQNSELVIPGFGFQLQWNTPYVISIRDFYRASPLPEYTSPWPQSWLAAHNKPQLQNLKTENLRCKNLKIYMYIFDCTTKSAVDYIALLYMWILKARDLFHSPWTYRKKWHFSPPSKPYYLQPLDYGPGRTYANLSLKILIEGNTKHYQNQI